MALSSLLFVYCNVDCRLELSGIDGLYVMKETSERRREDLGLIADFSERLT